MQGAGFVSVYFYIILSKAVRTGSACGAMSLINPVWVGAARTGEVGCETMGGVR
jgi:hypothetical protein